MKRRGQSGEERDIAPGRAGRPPGRIQAGPHPLGGSADVPVGRGAPVTYAVKEAYYTLQGEGGHVSLAPVTPRTGLRTFVAVSGAKFVIPPS